MDQVYLSFHQAEIPVFPKTKLSPEQAAIKKLERENKKLSKKVKELEKPKDFYDEYSQPFNPEMEKRRQADMHYAINVICIGVGLMLLGLLISWLTS